MVVRVIDVSVSGEQVINQGTGLHQRGHVLRNLLSMTTVVSMRIPVMGMDALQIRMELADVESFLPLRSD